MPRIELIPTPNGDGTVALRAARLTLRERVRRWLDARRRPPRRLLPVRG